MILIAISSISIAAILGYAALEIAKLKYRERAELAAVKSEVVELRKELGRIDPKDLRDRLVALENRAGVRLY